MEMKMTKLRYLLILLCLCFSFNSYAQPTEWPCFLNLNDLAYYLDTNNEISGCNASDGMNITIDKTSNLENLKYLNQIESFGLIIDLKSLPEELISCQFDNVKSISINCGLKLLDISAFPAMPNLEELSISFMGTQLPEKLSESALITRLYLDVPNVEKLDMIANLSKLKDLDISAESLQELPLFDSNNVLESIDLSVGDEFDINENFKNFSHLNTFILSGSAMETFPDFLSKELDFLRIESAPKLKDVSQLSLYPELRSIDIGGTSLREFKGDFSKHTKLSTIRINDNSFLQAIDAIGTIKNIKELRLNNLPQLKSITCDFSQTSFEKIYLRKLPVIEDISGIATCTTLKSLNIGNTGLKTLPENFDQLINLKFLELRNNKELIDISSIKQMKTLHSLQIHNCPKLSEIPESFSSNDTLDFVIIKGVPSLVSIKGLAGLKNLRSLTISRTHDDFTLPENFSSSANLQFISLECNITDISNISNFPKLQKVYLKTPELQEIPDSLNTNTTLSSFLLYDSKVKDVQKLESFTLLSEIVLKNNDYLQSLPDFEKMNNLKVIQVVNNKLVKDIRK